jgi:putative transposase
MQLDEYVIMPNHTHGIIYNVVGAGSPRPWSPRPWFPRPETPANLGRENPAPTVGKIVAFFKYQTTKQFNALRNIGMQKLWQRNYYEHIIRNNDNLDKIREYIINNPLRWLDDRNHP